MALFRHFCERDDFEIAVASRYPVPEGPGTQLLIRGSLVGSFLRRAGWARLATNVDYLWAGSVVPRNLLAFARTWQPDVIFSVADDFHAPIAWRLARRLGLPFAVNFQDLFACSSFLAAGQRPYGWLAVRLLARYRVIQAEADAVFHTSPGMRAWFGSQGRGEVLYPLAGSTTSVCAAPSSMPSERLTLLYTGNCYGPYGQMLLRLARHLVGHRHWSLAIYAMGNDWRSEDVEFFTRSGVYRGYRPYNELEGDFLAADALLTAMSFDPVDRVFVETSFTTKLVDYTAWGKPIVIWAPTYSSAAQFVAETGAAALVERPDPDAVLSVLELVRQDPGRRRELAGAAVRVAKSVFAPDRLHQILRANLLDLATRK